MLIKPPNDDGIIPRDAMPQIDAPDIPVLLAYLGSLDIRFSAGVIDPHKVSAHQMIDPDKAMAIPVSILAFPCLISREPIIIDGDHRWYAHVQRGSLMPFIRIEEDFFSAVKFIKSFPKTYEEAA